MSINFGLDKAIKYIFDDHKLKVNKFSSFNALRVYPTKKIMHLKPSLCVILAYLHAKKIIKNNLSYIKEGGKFLILFPKVKIISKNNFKNFI